MPYQRLETASLKGEEWRNIAGLEGYFQVSSFGRIKRLEYDLLYSDGRVYRKPERIIKPVAMKIHNHFMNDDVYFLRNTVKLSGITYNFSVARLVYYTFIEEFDLEDKSIIILCKKGSELDIRLKYLTKATREIKQQRSHALNRFPPIVLDEETQRLRNIRLAEAGKKEVSQYDSTGKRMSSYLSINQAAESNDISPSHISSAALGNSVTAGGFYWRHGAEEQIDLLPVREKIRSQKESQVRSFGKKVTQYTMSGIRVAVFPSIAEAARATGMETANISAMLNGDRRSAGGFYWKKGSGKAKINLEGYEYGEQRRASARWKPVMQLNSSGKLIKEYNSVKLAAELSGIPSASISAVLGGHQLTAGGFKWKAAKKK